MTPLSLVPSPAPAKWANRPSRLCECGNGAYSLRLVTAGFFEPIGEHGFGVIGGPLIGRNLVKTRSVAVQAQEHLTQVGPGLDTVTLGPGKVCA